MRSLSKLFNALLTKPSFIKSHLHRSVHNNEEILLVFYNKFSLDRSHFASFTVHPSRSPHLEYTDFITCPVNAPADMHSVIGSNHGLICFTNGSYPTTVIHIWNPSLSALLPLPPNIVSPSCDDVLFRFGFDPKTDDYKVVKLTSLPRSKLDFESLDIQDFVGTSLNVVKDCLEVEVYSMRKGRWKIITKTFPSHVTEIFGQDEVCVDGHDGHVHWLGYDMVIRNPKKIVSFDLGSETFSEISLPNHLQDHGIWIRLAVLGKKLCVMTCITDGECEVWVMDEYGVTESWVKNHIFSQFSGEIAPFGFTLNNEFLLEGFYGRLALYDPIVAKVKSFKIMARQCGGTQIVHYVESCLGGTS